MVPFQHLIISLSGKSQWGFLRALTLKLSPSVAHHQERQSTLDLNDMRGIGAFPIVVPYSKISGFPQIIEKNQSIGKKFYKHCEKANLF